MLQNGSPAVRRVVVAALLSALSAGASWAAVPKEPVTPLDQKEFFRPELYISSQNLVLQDVLTQLPNRSAWEALLQRHGGANAARVSAFIDPRSGTATNLLGVFPLIPGNGDGNTVTLAELSRQLGRPVRAVDDDVVGAAVLRFVEAHADVLGIDVAQLGPVRARAANAALWHVNVPQYLNGIRVRHGRLSATISHGNLVMIGTETWGDARIDTTPRLRAEQALDAGFAFADGRIDEDVILREPALEVVPFAPPQYQLGEGFGGPLGAGFGHRLVWTFIFQRMPEHPQWEVMVDAQTGEVIAFEDKNHYIAKQATGGVYPLTNTEICPTPQTCGTMQLGWPMPFADTGLAAPNNFTNSAGVFDYVAGTATSTLVGRFVRINDTCGAISLSSPTGDLAFGGANTQHDCVTPGVGGAGNTSSSRSCFYEVNKLVEQAKGYLPANPWLQGTLQSNVNLNQTCNAFWSGGTINFFKSGGGCRNTGEIAAVFDHEWGHGMDANDTNGFLSNSSEAYADIAANYRLQASCVGHGFWWTLDRGCGMTADGTGFNASERQAGPAHCDLDCSGVRDSDYLKHNPNTPDTALNFVCPSCSGGSGPCGRQVHCSASPVRQAAWDLVARDLRGAPFNLDSQTAFIVGNKLFFQGSGNVGLWHACTCGVSSDGCGATHGYMQWIAADDDNGNLNDGTPHMTAIHAAYDRHGIGCSVIAPTNSGCAAGPTGATTLAGVPGNLQNSLSWTPVAGATRYWVYRTEGHAGCDFGKALIAEVIAPLSYVDTQVATGRPYSYNVVAAGVSSSCYGPVSNCVTLTPVATADFSLSCNPATLTINQGANATSTCTVQSLNAFSAPVTLGCTGLPAGVTCGYVPPAVTPAPNGTANSTLTVTVGAAVPPGNYPFQAQGQSGALTHTFNMTLTVNSQGVAPFALAVDASGNSVFQPNETATMTPTWRNTGTAPITLTGATTNFIGPAGGVYTNPDSTASYGTIGVAAQASCSTAGDCYTVLATAATRPVTHWDSTIDETVNPTATTKTWTLHIGDSFTDVPSSSGFYRFVETILHKNVTGGCTTTTYCPLNSTTREQMAVFVLVSKEAPGYLPPACSPPNMFTDVPETSPFCRWIEELANRGVVGGCAPGLYCPSDPATREQMAVFVLRTLDPTLNPPACAPPNLFADVPETSPFCKWIEELANRGVVTGCGGGNYCPTANVNREQMSVFLAVTFSLALYGL